MKRPKIRCAQCRQWFQPTRFTQTTCPKKRCQGERHRKNCALWHEKNPGKGPAPNKVRKWAGNLSYWQHYRKTHPNYRQRDNARRKRAHRAATRDSRRDISLEKLRSIQSQGLENAATRDSTDRRVEALLSYLIWKETPQNETQAHVGVI